MLNSCSKGQVKGLEVIYYHESRSYSFEAGFPLCILYAHKLMYVQNSDYYKGLINTIRKNKEKNKCKTANEEFIYFIETRCMRAFVYLCRNVYGELKRAAVTPYLPHHSVHKISKKC